MPWQGPQKILYRSWPRFSSSGVSGSGNAFDSLGTNKSSSAIEPRATVFSINGRSERPSSKNGLGESGVFLGWSAISWRIWQPLATTESMAAHRPSTMREVLVIMHLGNVMRVKPLQKTCGIRKVKFFVAGLNADEEAVRRGMRETVRIENRMVRLRQPVEREHSKHSGERSKENGHLKRDRNERRPAIQRAPGDIHRIGVDVYPVLEAKAAKPSQQAADERDKWDVISAHGHGFRHAFHRKRSVAFVVAVSCLANFRSGMNELLRLFKLANHAVNV